MRELGRLPLPCDKGGECTADEVGSSTEPKTTVQLWVVAKYVSFSHVLMRRTSWKQSNWRTSKIRKRDMTPSTGS